MAKVYQFKAPLRVGLTGGIASGKTLVAAMLEVCGAPVALADQVARGIMEQPGPVRDGLEQLLGTEAYLPDGSLDRAALGARLFADTALLDRVNRIVHPAVAAAALRWHKEQGPEVPYTVYESALLFETEISASFDLIVLVHAPRAERLRRAMRRDGADEMSVLARMDAQLSDEQRLSRGAYVILNDGSTMLLPQIHRLHRALVTGHLEER